MAARYIPHVEVIDYADRGKVDAPSGTARELASRLGAVPGFAAPATQEGEHIEAGVRGAAPGGIAVHSIRLPGYVIGLEAVFGLPDQRLHLRHDAGSSALPYVDGALLAIRKVGGLVGLRRGLDKVMDW